MARKTCKTERELLRFDINVFRASNVRESPIPKKSFIYVDIINSKMYLWVGPQNDLGGSKRNNFIGN